MMRRPRRDTLVLAAGGVLTLVGVVALAWPVSHDASRVAAAPVSLPSASAGVADMRPSGDSADVAMIVRTNMFSESRAPNAQRYDVSGAGGRVAARAPVPRAVMPPGFAGDSAGSEPHGSSGPQLFGILAGPDGLAALMRLGSAGSAAASYHVGDRSGSYRVVSIGDRDVVLDGPAGRRTLRLSAPSAAPTPP